MAWLAVLTALTLTAGCAADEAVQGPVAEAEASDLSAEASLSAEAFALGENLSPLEPWCYDKAATCASDGGDAAACFDGVVACELPEFIDEVTGKALCAEHFEAIGDAPACGEKIELMRLRALAIQGEKKLANKAQKAPPCKKMVDACLAAKKGPKVCFGALLKCLAKGADKGDDKDGDKPGWLGKKWDGKGKWKDAKDGAKDDKEEGAKKGAKGAKKNGAKDGDKGAKDDARDGKKKAAKKGAKDGKKADDDK